jgi:hypothetical protein
MRNFIDIIKEAPLADIEVHGDPLDQEGSFSAKDRQVIQRNIIKGIYKKSLKYLPFNLYVYILNKSPLDKLGKKFPETEITDIWLMARNRLNSDVKNIFTDLMRVIDVNKEKDPTAIHFVMGDNYSEDNQIVPTPWILVHRLMHCVVFLNLNLNLYELGKELGFESWDWSAINDRKDSILHFLMFKSAQNNSLLSDSKSIIDSELLAELATEYLIRGEIRLQNLEELSPEKRQILIRWTKKIERRVDEKINLAAGKAFYI